nr:hypothetical transcript [Hymenolepis microstoma]
MSDLQVTLDHIQSKRFKKESGYETTLAKMLDKAKKTKGGKVLYEMKSKDNSMNFRGKGKKKAPVNMLDYSKIRSLKKSSPTEKAVAFAYPGPDRKNPIMLYAMRFEKEDGYNEFTRRVELPSPSKYRDSEYINPPTGRLSQPSRSKSQEIGDQSSPIKYRRNRSRIPASEYTTTTPTSSSSASTSTERGHSLSKSNEKMKNKCKIAYISTDKLYPRYEKRRQSPVISAGSTNEISYISTKSRIYDSPPSYRRSYSVRPQSVRVRNVYRVTKISSIDDSSSASWTSASSDFTELSLSSLEYLMGSSDFSTDTDFDW